MLQGNPKISLLDNNGNPATGYKIYTYAAGTSTPRTTYTDYGYTSENTNPIVLDSRGEAVAYLNLPTKFVFTTPEGAPVWTMDYLNAVTNILVTDIRDYGAKGNGVTDDTAAIQTAVDASPGIIYFPPGTYRLATQTNDVYAVGGNTYSNGYSINVPNNVTIVGAGKNTILQLDVANTSPFYNRSKSGFAIKDLTIYGFAGGDNCDGIKLVQSNNYLISNVEVSGCRMGFQNIGCANAVIIDCYAHDQIRSIAGDDARGFNVGDETDHLGTSDVHLANCIATGSADHGFSVTGSKVFMTNCYSGNNSNCGFYYGSFPIYQTIAVNCHAENNAAWGWFLATLDRCGFSNCISFYNGKDGWKMIGCTSNTFSGCQAIDNGTLSAGTYDGFLLTDDNSTGSYWNSLSGCISQNQGTSNQRYGIKVYGTYSGNNIINGGAYSNNATGNFSVLATDAVSGLLHTTYSGTTPVANVTPTYVGEELLLDNSGTLSWWRSTGLTNADWLKMSN